jgi:hypothetical protein
LRVTLSECARRTSAGAVKKQPGKTTSVCG